MLAGIIKLEACGLDPKDSKFSQAIIEKRNVILIKLSELLTKDNEVDILLIKSVRNIISIFNEIIPKQSLNGINEKTGTLEKILDQTEIFQFFFQVISEPSCPKYKFEGIMMIINNLMSYAINSSEKIEDSSLTPYWKTFLENFTKFVRDNTTKILYHFVIENDVENKVINQKKNLGFKRILIMEFFSLAFNYKKLYDELDDILSKKENHTLKLAFSYFFEYEKNSIYQNQFYKFIKTLFWKIEKFIKIQTTVNL
jgi:hypothetical protein